MTSLKNHHIKMVEENSWIAQLTEGTMNDLSGAPGEATAAILKDVNQYDSVDQQQLAQQCLEQMAAGNYSKIIQEILLGNLPPDTKNPEGYTVLHMVAWKDLPEKVAYLLDEGQFDVNILSSTGQTPLSLAAMNGCIRTMKVLLNRGADIELADKVKFTPVFTAANHN